MLHLYHDRRAIFQSGRVNLADRRRGQRFVVEVGKELVDGTAELGLDGRVDRFGRVGGDICLKIRQFGGERQANNVRARREDLAELDKGGAELDQCQTDPALASRVGERATERTT